MAYGPPMMMKTQNGECLANFSMCLQGRGHLNDPTEKIGDLGPDAFHLIQFTALVFSGFELRKGDVNGKQMNPAALVYFMCA